MNINKLSIEGYRLFNNKFNLQLNKGLNILIGENGCGKTSVIDSLRLLFAEDEYGRTGITEYDFYKSTDVKELSDMIIINCEFENLEENTDRLAFLTWLDGNDTSKAKLNLSIENIENNKGYYNKKKMWGGESQSGLFEYKVMDKINCIYLPPLRDAEARLKAYRGSRLARLFKNLVQKEDREKQPIVEEVKKFNEGIIKKDKKIEKVDLYIRKQLEDAIGKEFGQDTKIQYSEATFSKIVESLKLVFFPNIQEDKDRGKASFRSLSENSLGYNNLIYIATILAEFELIDKESSSFNLLLIEEPEAHLHPQLQIRLLQFLQTKALDEDIQIIVTSHSPTLTASVDLESITVITRKGNVLPVATSIKNCGLTNQNKFFLERWLDVTKSTLLFSRGVLFVEGISEALVIPELAKLFIKEYNKENPKKKLPVSFDEVGISIINMNGIYFNHFMQLFKGYRFDNKNKVDCDKIPLLCSGVTDCDPIKDSKPIPSELCDCDNPKYYMIEKLENNCDNCRLFSNLKTFEYDLAMEGDNLRILSASYATYYDEEKPILSKTAKANSEIKWSEKEDNVKAEKAKWLLDHIKKGEFAQYIACQLDKEEITLEIPEYIKKAILWVFRGTDVI